MLKLIDEIEAAGCKCRGASEEGSTVLVKCKIHEMITELRKQVALLKAPEVRLERETPAPENGKRAVKVPTCPKCGKDVPRFNLLTVTLPDHTVSRIYYCPDNNCRALFSVVMIGIQRPAIELPGGSPLSLIPGHRP